jgi:hypothetical protein
MFPLPRHGEDKTMTELRDRVAALGGNNRFDRGCTYHRAKPEAANGSGSQFKPRQRTRDQALTITLALSGHIHEVLRERLPSTVGMTVDLKGDFIRLDNPPRVVQRADENTDGVGIERCGMVLEIIAQLTLPH